jgi:hypothetical protein
MESNRDQQIFNELRRNRRERLKEYQEFNRLKAFGSNRFVNSEVLTEKDVNGLCSRIKRRKHATAKDIVKLSNAFIQSNTNISAFVKTTGAINILVKELTGLDKSQQLLAAQCFCNLTLGDEVCCSKVATFAGSYLMILVMATDVSLAVSLLVEPQFEIAHLTPRSIPENLLMDSSEHHRVRTKVDEHLDVAGNFKELPSPH